MPTMRPPADSTQVQNKSLLIRVDPWFKVFLSARGVLVGFAHEYLWRHPVLHPIEQRLLAMLPCKLRHATLGFRVRRAQLLFAGGSAQCALQGGDIVEAIACDRLWLRPREIEHQSLAKPQRRSRTRVRFDQHVQQLVMDGALQRARLAQHLGWLQLNGASAHRGSDPSWLASGVAERGHSCVNL